MFPLNWNFRKEKISMALIHIDRPKNLTEATALSNTPISKCEILYEKNENGLYEFVGLYDPDIPDEEYPNGMAAFSFRSGFVDVVTIYKDTSVWNVEGSSNDKWEGRKKPNWLEIWNIETKNSVKSDSETCYVAGSVKTNGKNNCKGCTLGGHMALSSTTVNPTKSDYIYIVPICKSHNNTHNKAEMKICEDVKAVKMNRFMD